MKKVLKYVAIIFTALIFIQCNEKLTAENYNVCDIQKVYTKNAAKVTISSGVWGTVSSMEGNCMPPIAPNSTTCTNCAVQRTIKIYQYTTLSNATPSANSSVFYDSFNTALVAQVNTDSEGFFQVNLPAGNYTIAIVENGKLYANGFDGNGGISPFSYNSGVQKINLTMTYKAVF